MSEEIQVLLPKLGESIHSATIVQWFKKVGDPVRLDEPLLEVSTDKVNSEIPSPAAGQLKAIHALPDQELQVGQLIAIIAAGAVSEIDASLHRALPSNASSSEALDTSDEMKDFYSPALLRIAKSRGIGLQELEKITGTGMGGRLTKRDLEEYLDKKVPAPAPCPVRVAPSSTGADIERLKMSGMRKMIAENMVRSFYAAPHASLVTEVDVTAILKRIQREKDQFLAQHGCKLTITAFIARAISKALQEYPLINSSLEDDTILLKKFVNLGVAVSIDQGLVVPVIKRCQNLTITEIAQCLSELSAKARAGKLSPDDVRDGTITMTNFGMSGVQIGIPIIRYPEVAIVGVGATYKRVVPLEEDVLAVRTLMHISLTFDHRVLDGMYGCGYLGAVKKHLEDIE